MIRIKAALFPLIYRDDAGADGAGHNDKEENAMAEFPVQVTFRDMETSPAVEAAIRDKAETFDRYADRITHCRVVVEAPHQRHRKGKLYHVRIDLGLAGGALVVGREGPMNHAHEDVYVAIRDSFRAMTRMLEEHERKRRGDVKAHGAPPHGVIASMLPDHGFIRASDGQEVYFHRNSVVNGNYDKLEVGDEVRLAVAEGEKGPQASAVTPVGKHHIVGK